MKGRNALLVAAIVLTALNLRTALASVSPLYTYIQDDLGIGRGVAGLIVTLPVLCMAIFAPLASLVGDRLGRRSMILLSVVAIGAAISLRLQGGLFVLFASAVAAGIGIATIQSLMPEVIKENFPERSATLNGAYTASMALGAAVAASTVVPIADAFGSWPTALSVWGILAVPAVLAWLPMRESDEERQSENSVVVKLPLGVPRVWLTMAFFAATSLMYFSILSWLSQIFEDEGLSQFQGGLILSVFTGVQILSGFLVPTLTNRFTDRRPTIVAVVSTTILGLLLVSFLPTATVWMPWLCAALLGLSQGALFPLALTLPLDNTRSPQMAGRLTSACFLAGYSVAALGPAVIGATRDASGSFTAPLLALAAIAAAQIALTTRMTPGFNIEDEE